MDLNEYKKKIANLSVNEQKLRDLYLRDMALGKVQGPPTGYASIDKPWLKYYSEEAILGDFDYSSVYESLVTLNCNNLNKVAINYFGKKYKYSDLIKKIDIVAKSFLEYGVKAGDVVTLALPNIPENVFCFYALNKIGAIANFVDLRLKGEKLINAISGTGSKLVVATDLFISNLDEVIDKIDVSAVVVASPSDSLPIGIKQLYKLKQGKCKCSESFKSWKNFELKGKNSCLDTDFKANDSDSACILHTSGTTGTPKGVVLTNRNFTSMAYQVKNSGLKYTKDDTFLSQVPPFLAYNILSATNNPLSMGLEIIMLPDYQPTKFAENIKKHKPNHVIAGPADWNNFLDNDRIVDSDFSFLVSMISGSDKITEEKKQEIGVLLHQLGCSEDILEGYGLTEVGAAAVMNLPHHNVPNSVGIPLRHVNIGVFKEGTDEEVYYNEDGEICLSGPTIMDGYYNNIEETNNTRIKHSDGSVWIHTGDFGNVNSDGNVFLKGRIKRVIVRHDGMKVSPYDLEKVITQLPDVDNCCVVGIDDDEHGFGCVPIAAVVLSENSILSEREAVDLLTLKCEKELSERYRPNGFVFFDKLPLTEVGKVDYKKVASQITGMQKVLKK